MTTVDISPLSCSSTMVVIFIIVVTPITHYCYTVFFI